jgi:hypothetical protein
LVQHGGLVENGILNAEGPRSKVGISDFFLICMSLGVQILGGMDEWNWLNQLRKRTMTPNFVWSEEEIKWQILLNKEVENNKAAVLFPNCPFNWLIFL